MKLEIKHIYPYLPYRLKGICTDEYQGIEIVHAINFKNDEVTTDIDDCCISLFKPILRPLSDLTKEIEINGEKFVPIDYFLGSDGDNILNAIQSNNNVEVIEFILVQKLLEWHFDIYGLIDDGLAIDINTLNK